MAAQGLWVVVGSGQSGSQDAKRRAHGLDAAHDHRARVEWDVVALELLRMDPIDPPPTRAEERREVVVVTINPARSTLRHHESSQVFAHRPILAVAGRLPAEQSSPIV